MPEQFSCEEPPYNMHACIMSELNEFMSYTLVSPFQNSDAQFPCTVMVQVCTVLQVNPGEDELYEHAPPDVQPFTPLGRLKGVPTKVKYVVASNWLQLAAVPNSIPYAVDNGYVAYVVSTGYTPQGFVGFPRYCTLNCTVVRFNCNVE